LVTYGVVHILIGWIALQTALGVRLIRRGITRKFTDDLAGGVGPVTVRMGEVGYLVKGVRFVRVGGLFGWAGISHEPDRAGGLVDALRTVRDLPFGGVLLTVMALGLICFGVYCFFWARGSAHRHRAAAPN